MTTKQLPIVSKNDWLSARRALLEQEKAFTRQRDALAAARRALPRVKVDELYTFEEPGGRVALRDLFGKHHQLVVYHFMFDPSWEQGCKSCSFVTGHLVGSLPHLAARDIALVAISRAPTATIEPFKKRMGWPLRWLSSNGSTFNHDYGVTFAPEEKGKLSYNFGTVANYGGESPGLSVFLREGDDVFHTYSTYARGLDLLIGAYNIMDLTPLGRQEENTPNMGWLRLHDSY
jgi:predicted dithiol-disulfide oxidoreductase (DUF899 family)